MIGFAEKLEGARDRYRRGDCCPVGALFLELGKTGSWWAYPGFDQIRLVFDDDEAKHWWLLTGERRAARGVEA